VLSDPIAALATPPGRSAVAVVRLSGVGALEVAARVVDGFAALCPRVATLVAFREADGELIDRGLVTLFPAPHSYTGDDLVEFSCHGGLLAPARLLAANADPIEVGGVAVAAPRDTTGAGDAFAAGFLVAWMAGAAPTAATVAGHRLAAAVLHRPGATIGAPG